MQTLHLIARAEGGSNGSLGGSHMRGIKRRRKANESLICDPRLPSERGSEDMANKLMEEAWPADSTVHNVPKRYENIFLQ